MKFSREFKIGFVALLAIALAIWGINYLNDMAFNVGKKVLVAVR